jgi:hypothetical protein
MTKPCEHCGKVIERPVNLSVWNWGRRRFCSVSCARRHAVITQPDKTGRGRAQRMFPDRPCEVCGRAPAGRGTVDRHHRNSDRLDNSPGNIAFLCRKHHQAAHRLSDGKVGGGPRPRIAALLHNRAMARAREASVLMSLGLTKGEVADALGVHPESIRRWFVRYPEVAP